MANKSNIEIILSAKDANLSAGVRKAQAALRAFSAEVGGGVANLGSMRAQVLQLAGAFAGLSAIGDVAAMLKTADQNTFALAASIKAANREFEVGSAGEWEATIAAMSAKLRIYSQSDIRGATARTIDMTKRLGLNAEQMQRVIELSADLSAGRTTLEGGVERVTAALRGEAEAAEFLGLTLNENYVKAWYEASAAHEKAWKDLSDLEKAQVRYQVFLEQAIPLHGKAAESVNTWSGALALVRTAVEDGISNNANLIESLRGVADTLRDNAAGIGAFAGKIANGAAEVIQFAASNREVILEVAKYGSIFLVAISVVKRLADTWRGLNAAMAVMTGLQIVPWLRALETSTAGALAGLTGLKIGFVGLMGATAAFFAAYRAGEWLTMRGEMEGIATAQKELERSTGAVAQKFREISASTGVTISTMEQLDQAVRDGRIHHDELTGTWLAGAKEQQDATRQTAAVSKQATGAALEEMKKKYQAYAAEVRRLQDEIAGRERSLAAELRELARSGMSDASAWQDQKREAEEYAQAAKRTAEEANRAMEAGDTVTAGAKWKEAVALTDQAKASYKALNTEVRDGDRVLISQQQALKTAMDGVKASGEQAIEILKQQQEAAKAGMDSLLGESGFADLAAGMDAAEKQWLKNWQDMETEAVEAVETVRKRIDAMVEDRHVTIWVEEKVKKATGGLVHRLATGGRLPGYGGGDRISALLEAGEFVIRKEAVSKFGAGLFHALNSLRLPEIPRFAAGGQVGSSEAMTINFAFGGAPPVTSLRGSREQAVLLEREFARRAMRSSR